MSLKKLKDSLSKEATGMTRDEAVSAAVCAQCRNKPKFYTKLGRKEFRISGLCEFCFDMACDPVRCANCQTPESWHKYNKTTCKDWKPVEL